MYFYEALNPDFFNREDSSFWIGLSHWYGSDDWLWADNTTISWENWASNNDKMTSDSRRCALASGLYPFTWRSDSCVKRRHSLCQYPGGKGRDRVLEMKSSGIIFEPHLRHYIVSWPQGYTTFFMLNSSEHKIYHAHNCKNANNRWHFNIYLHDKYNI